MVFRMDLLPETEQIHILKIGMFGLPRSVVVNITDLVKIPKEQDNRSIIYSFNKSAEEVV